MTFDSVAESLMSLLAIRVLLVFNDKGNKEKLEQVQREIDLFESKFFFLFNNQFESICDLSEKKSQRK
jgi:hypothetical protein